MLSDLAHKLVDQVALYGLAKDVANNPKIAAAIQRAKDERAHLLQDINAKIFLHGIAPIAQRAFVQLHVLVDKDDKSALAEVKRGEAFMRDMFVQAAGDERLSAHTRNYLQTVLSRIDRTCDEISELQRIALTTHSPSGRQTQVMRQSALQAERRGASTVPLVGAGPLQTIRIQAAEVESTMCGSLAGKRVLVVEDDSLIAMSLEDLLTSEGALVSGPFANCAQAMAFLESNRPDLAVLDIELEDGRSYPIAEQLKHLHVEFVVTSGRLAPDCELAGAPFLAKPYPDDALLRTLGQLATAR